MFTRIKYYIGSIALAGILACNASASERLNVVFDNAYPPYMSGDGADVQGLYIELITKIFSKADVEVTNIGTPWKRALQESLKGTVAIGGIFPDRQRREVLYFSEPIFSEDLVVYVKKGNGFPLVDERDLQNKLIGTVRGYSYGQTLESLFETKRLKEYSARDNQALFGMLVRDRIDCLIAEHYSSEILIRKHNLTGQVERLPASIYSSSGHLAVAKDSPLVPFIAVFNQALLKSKQDGSLDKWVDAFFSKQKAI